MIKKNIDKRTAKIHILNQGFHKRNKWNSESKGIKNMKIRLGWLASSKTHPFGDI